MNLDFKIEGLEKFKNSSMKIRQAIDNEIKIAVKSSGEQVRGEAIKSILSGGKNGVIYTRGNIVHQSSAKGQAPANDTGLLAGSISTVMRDEETALVIARAKYATFLEFGTAKMGARPFMFPALEKSKVWITERLKKAVRQGIQKGKV